MITWEPFLRKLTVEQRISECRDVFTGHGSLERKVYSPLVKFVRLSERTLTCRLLLSLHRLGVVMKCNKDAVVCCNLKMVKMRVKPPYFAACSRHFFKDGQWYENTMRLQWVVPVMMFIKSTLVI